MKEDKNSMMYWYPRVKELDVPQPNTIFISTGEDWEELRLVAEGQKELRNMSEIHEACRSIGYPVFARTDQMAAKHSWNRTCFISGEDVLRDHIANLVEGTLDCDMIGRIVRGIAIREYIEMESAFTAFNGLPISRERRYFLRDGEVICHHPYWPEESIWFGVGQKEPTDWKHALSRINYESFDEIDTLTKYAGMIGSTLEGYWSIDFCRGRNGDWYFIDCALGENSWHPDCGESRASDSS